MAQDYKQTVIEKVIFSTVLDEHELKHADYVAKQRNRFAHSRGYKPKHGQQEAETNAHHAMGAQSELAVAKILNLYWHHNIGISLDFDLSPNIQIRSTNHPLGRLVLHDQDKDTHRFIFVLIAENIFTLKGWVWGHEGKRKEWFIDPTGKNRWAYFVPAKTLRSMKTFKC